MKTFADLLSDLRQSVPEVEPDYVAQLIESKDDQVVLLDVRDEVEITEGIIANALHLPRSFLELQIEGLIPNRDTPIICYCAGGTRSLFAADTLLKMGYSSVHSMRGGVNQWQRQGYHLETPSAIGLAEKRRYQRHILLPEVGMAGQIAISKARVLLVGLGGLGSPVAYYLAAAGVGNLGLIDHDCVEESNLQRQILYSISDVGRRKVEVAQEKLSAFNNLIEITPYPVRLTEQNALQTMRQYDIIVDGSDNFTTRYLVNDVCIELAKPNVHGSIYRFEGQVSTFWPGQGPCYRCLYHEPPSKTLAPNCAEAGVLGVLPGTIGLLQATEVLKLILGVGETLVGRLLLYNALKGEFRTLKLHQDTHCICGRLAS